MFEEILLNPAFQISLLLFVALGGYLLAAKIHQSAVVGEILVGLILGPSVLGLITYTDYVQYLANFGSIILLFVIGFEFELKDITNWKYFVIALCGVIVPLVGGIAVAQCFGMVFYDAMFIGTALTATSIAITAKVLQEMNKLHHPFAKAIIGAAVIDDVLGLIVLSICKDLSSSGILSVSSITLNIVKAVGFVIIGAVIGIFCIPKIMEKIDQTQIVHKFPEFVFIFTIMVAFIYALCAELVGISAIVGAFLAGVCVSRVKLKYSMDVKLGSKYLYILFASIFFVSLGIIADLRIVTPDMLIFIGVLCIIAILTKIIGCSLPAKLMGMNWKDSLMIGVGMTPRGEVAMIVGLLALTHFNELAEIAGPGLEANVYQSLGNSIFVAIVVVSLVTTIIVPLIYNGIFFRKERKNNEKGVEIMKDSPQS